MKRGRRRISLKSRREIDIMRTANAHVAEILEIMLERAEPGISTWDLDQVAREELGRRGVQSPFLGYYGYPAVICASVNDEVVHGIPRRDKVLQAGDVLSLDFGVIFDGYVGDAARTVIVGDDAERKSGARELIEATRESLERALTVCTPRHRLSDIGRVVQDYAEGAGYGVVREFVGHGIGTRMHEEPQVPNYYDGPMPRLRTGLVIAIEPMLTVGKPAVAMQADGWTAVTRSGNLAAHFEDTVAILDAGPYILSRI